MDDQLGLVNVVLQRMQKTLECTICLDLLLNPYTTKCGHSFCNDCLERLFLVSKGSTKCPLCNASVTKRSLTQNPKIVSFVTAVKKIILSIRADFGFAEPVKKLAASATDSSNEPAAVVSKRVQRKRDQTTLFDAELFVAKIVPIKGIKLALPQGSSNGIENKISQKRDKKEEVGEKKEQIEMTSKYKTNGIMVETREKMGKPEKAIGTKRKKQNLENVKKQENQRTENVKGDIFQKKGKRLVNSKKNIANSNDVSDQNKSFEKVTDWLTKKCPVDYSDRAESTSETPTAAARTPPSPSQQSTIVYQFSPKKCQPISLTNLETTNDPIMLSNALGDEEAEAKKSLMKNLPITSKVALPNISTVMSVTATDNAIGSKRKLDYEVALAKPATKIRKNIRFASEVKTLLLDNSKSSAVEVKRRTKKSPGWATIDSTKRELRSQVRALNITGGEVKPGNISRTETPVSESIQTPETEILIEEETQASATKMQPLPSDNYTVRRKTNMKKRQRSSFLFYSAEKVNKSNKKTDPVLTKEFSNSVDVVPSTSVDQCQDPLFDILAKPVSPLEHFSLKSKSTQSVGLFSEKNYPSFSCAGKQGNLESVKGSCNVPKHSSFVNSGTARDQSLNSSSVTGSSREHENTLHQLSGNSRNITNLELSQQRTNSCYHSIPCHLFKALKMFILSQKCHSDEKHTAETDPIANLFNKDDSCPSNSQAQFNCKSINNENQNSSASFHDRESPVQMDVSFGNQYATVKDSSNENCSAVQVNTLNCGNHSAKNLMENDNVDTLTEKPCPINDVFSSESEADNEPFTSKVNSSLVPPPPSIDYGASRMHENPSQSPGSTFRTKNKLLTSAPENHTKKNSSKIPVIEPTRDNLPTIQTRGNLYSTPAVNRSATALSSSTFVESSHMTVEVPTVRMGGKRKFTDNYGGNKKYKRIRTRKDSSDSSSNETPLHVESKEMAEKQYHQDSEEWRDFERIDENVIKCFDKADLNEQAEKASQGECNSDLSVLNSSPPQPYDVSNGRFTAVYSSSSEDEIPCTDEGVTMNCNDFATAGKAVELEPPNSMLSTMTDVPLSQSTENLINKCNQSLHQAEQLLEEDDRQQDIVDRNISFASAVSTQSAFISTQKQNKVEGEVMKLRAEINVLEELKRKKEAVSKASAQKKPVGRKPATRNVPTSDSLELFSTAPLSESENVSEPPPMSSKCEDKENADSAQRISISKRNYKNKRMIMVCTGLSPAEVTLTRQFASTICDKNSQVVSNWSPLVSHVIVHTDDDGVSERTLKYLYGVATGAWIVSHEWVKDSLRTGKLISEEAYEALDCTGVPGPLRGRTLLHHVFESCQLCLLPPFDNLTLLQVEDLVSICGAEIVHNTAAIKEKPGMKIVIVGSSQSSDAIDDEKFNGYICVTCDWLIECIGMASRISLIPYLIGEPSASRLTKSCVPTSLLCETQNIW